MCQLYLEKLSSAVGGDPIAEADYDWVLLEMYDQTVREHPGGRMRAYLGQKNLRNEPFILERIGEEGREIIDALRAERSGGRIRSPLRRMLRRPRTAVEWCRDQLCRLFFGKA